MTDLPVAIALDLGSTRFKLGVLDERGVLRVAFQDHAPTLRGAGLIREGDPDQFLEAASRLLEQAAGRWPGVPLGLVSQRSTFTAWREESGATLIPMISWQDRRAADWCAAHRADDHALTSLSGLLLSPHYLGAKLAAMQSSQPELRRDLHAGDVRIGTLDAWLKWHWSRASVHQTDLTMAARTGLADITRGEWSTPLCRMFDVPLAALPRLRPSNRQSLELTNGLELVASIADQASSAIAVLDPAEDAALVNFGTGAFVLYPQAEATTRQRGYLTGPVLSPQDAPAQFALEGTINGAGPALEQFHPGPTNLPEHDDCPQGFAIPDLTGVGSPHWREEIGLTLSDSAQRATPAAKRRIVLEGLLFRVLEIFNDLTDGHHPERVLISGGAVRDAAIGLGLARLIEQPVLQLTEPETTLLGAARLAAGLPPYSQPTGRVIHPAAAGAYLKEKYPRWRAWARAVLGN